MSNTYAHKARWHLIHHMKCTWWEQYDWYRKNKYIFITKIKLHGKQYITKDKLEKQWFHKYCYRPSGWNNLFHDRPMRRRVKGEIIRYLRNTGYEPVFDIFGKPFVYYD